MVYNVQLTDRAKNDLQRILDDESRYAPAARLAYIASIEDCCGLLTTMPNRFAEQTINQILYRSFSFGAHRLFYRVSEANQTVSIVAVLHGHRDFKQHL